MRNFIYSLSILSALIVFAFTNQVQAQHTILNSSGSTTQIWNEGSWVTPFQIPDKDANAGANSATTVTHGWGWECGCETLGNPASATTTCVWQALYTAGSHWVSTTNWASNYNTTYTRYFRHHITIPAGHFAKNMKVVLAVDDSAIVLKDHIGNPPWMPMGSSYLDSVGGFCSLNTIDIGCVGPGEHYIQFILRNTATHYYGMIYKIEYDLVDYNDINIVEGGNCCYSGSFTYYDPSGSSLTSFSVTPTTPGITISSASVTGGLLANGWSASNTSTSARYTSVPGGTAYSSCSDVETFHFCIDNTDIDNFGIIVRLFKGGDLIRADTVNNIPTDSCCGCDDINIFGSEVAPDSTMPDSVDCCYKLGFSSECDFSEIEFVRFSVPPGVTIVSASPPIISPGWTPESPFNLNHPTWHFPSPPGYFAAGTYRWFKFCFTNNSGSATFPLIIEFTDGNFGPICIDTLEIKCKNVPDNDSCDCCNFEYNFDGMRAVGFGSLAFILNNITVSNPVCKIRANVVSANVTQFPPGSGTSYPTFATFVSSLTPCTHTGLGTSEITSTCVPCQTFSSSPFNFMLNIPHAPPFHHYQVVKVCIHYTIIDCDCDFCDTTICYKFIRRWMHPWEHSETRHIDTLKITNKDNSDMPQIATEPFLEMEMKNETEGMFTINNPAEDEYTAGITIHKVSLKAESGIKVTDMTPDRKTWSTGVPTENGMTCTGILNPGGSIVFTVEYDNTAKLKYWLNDVLIAYTVEGVPDTLYGSLKIKSRTPGASGGDLLLQDTNNTGTATRARTFALSFDAYNLSADSIAKVILRVKDGSIIAVGPPMSVDSTHLESYFTTGGQWKLLSSKPDENIAVMSPVPQGTTIQPVFITAVYNSGDSITINYETYNRDNDLITKGKLTVEAQTTGINGDIIKATISLSEAIPNPAQNKTLIKFNLSKDEPAVSLTVSDARGAIVKRLLTNESYQSGQHELLFDTSKLPSGVYYYTLTTSSGSQTRRLVILK